MATTGWKTSGLLYDLRDQGRTWEADNGADLNAAPAANTFASRIATINSGDASVKWLQSGMNGSGTSTNKMFLSGFGFTETDVPDGSVIDGVEIGIVEASSASLGSINTSAQLVIDGATTVGSAKAVSVSGTTFSSRTYGGAADLWGATLTDDDVRLSTFGFAFFGTQGGSTNQTIRVDYVQMRVHYTQPKQLDYYVRQGGIWKPVDPLYVRDGGVWKDCQLYVRDGGVWKKVYGL